MPFNPVDKRTAITYKDSEGNWHRVSKGAPEQVIDYLTYTTEFFPLSYLLQTFFLVISIAKYLKSLPDHRAMQPPG